VRRAPPPKIREPLIGMFHLEAGEAEISLGHFDAAIDEYRKAIDSGQQMFFVYTNLAAAYGHAGKMDEAKAAERQNIAAGAFFLGER
jgi:tetratricopeptide (TPR) repeat protein